MYIKIDVNTEIEINELKDLPKGNIIYGESGHEN